jgi:tight adherence protein B
MIHNIATFVFFAVLAGAFAGILLWQARRIARRDTLRRRLGRLESGGDPLLAAGDGDGERGGLHQLLLESGLGWTVGQLASRALLAAGCGAIVGIAAGSGFLGAMLALAGALALLVFVRAARAQRLKKCDSQMPQALEIMGLALRAGHALPSAVALAAAETPAPLALELRRASDEHALGRPLPEVLESLGQRLPGCEAVNTFVVAVLVLQETGGNLISVIDRIVENARARSSYQSRLRALTAEGRSSAKLLALLPGAFAVLAAVTDPTYADFMLRDPAGQMVALIAAGMWAAGILWTRRLVRALA